MKSKGKTELGFFMRTEPVWFVVYNKKEVVQKFYHAWTAHSFVSENRKKYFDDLEVLTKDVWEYRKEEQEKRQKKKKKGVSL